MADYIDRQAVIDALQKERDYLLKNGRTGAEHVLVHHALAVMDEIPAADVRPVVLCKDCVNWDRNTIEMHDRCNNEYEGVDKTQARFAECLQFSSWTQCMMTREDDFCSLGRPLDEEESGDAE